MVLDRWGYGSVFSLYFQKKKKKPIGKVESGGRVIFVLFFTQLFYSGSA